MTIQQTFNRIIAHLRQQQAKSTKDGNCLYWDQATGRRCAVGCLIPPSLYQEEFEGERLLESPVGTLLVRLGHDLRLCITLQNLHDDHPVSRWEEKFERVAAEYDLDLPAKKA